MSMADKPMTGLQKVALLLKSLPEETVAKVLKHMDPRQGKMLANELSKVANDPKMSEKLPTILDEAVKMMGDAVQRKPERPGTQTKIPPAPPSVAATAARPQNAMTETKVDLKIDDDLAAKMTGRSEIGGVEEEKKDGKGEGEKERKGGGETLAPVGDPLPALADLPAELLAAALESENGRTVFILMEKMRPDQAAQIYKNLSPEKRKEISLRFAEKTTVNEHIIKQIAHGVLKKCQALRSSTASANAEEDRQKLMATMIKALERTERIEMLAMLEKTDPSLTESVKNLLYEFEVIANMENSSIQKLLGEVNMQELALALLGAPPAVEERLMSNLSKRAQENLREEVSLVGNVTPAKVKEARQAVVLIIQQMDQRGEFLLRE
jgi:flagellar motor switch protein FliG